MSHKVNKNYHVIMICKRLTGGFEESNPDIIFTIMVRPIGAIDRAGSNKRLDKIQRPACFKITEAMKICFTTVLKTLLDLRTLYMKIRTLEAVLGIIGNKFNIKYL